VCAVNDQHRTAHGVCCSIKATDADKLKKEYNRLVEGLSGIARIADEAKADPGTGETHIDAYCTRC
jgi:hypothetical protein